jgi:hypothetical protein
MINIATKGRFVQACYVLLHACKVASALNSVKECVQSRTLFH